MKNIACLLLTLCLLGACTKAPQESNQGFGNKGKLSAEQKQKLASNLTGRWIWQAKKENKIVGMGEFVFEDNNGKIKGVTKTLITGLKAIPGKGGNPNVKAAVIAFPLIGKKEGNNKLTFEVKDDKGQVTKNEVVVKSDGVLMEGVSTQQLNAEEAKLLGSKESALKYNWTAVRITDKLDTK
jgi:hypothetical protein